MNLKPEDVAAHFARHALPYITLITGSETVLNLESLDAARARARQDGYEERQRFDTGSGFKWSDVLTESQSLSLFAARRIIEVHGEDKKPDKKSADILAALAAAPDDSLRILLHLPQLEKPHEQSWFKACFAGGNLAIISKTLYPHELARQADRRLRDAGLELTGAARERLLDYCQGNLLAAKQAIELLAIRARNPVHENDLLALLADAAMFSVFTCTEALWRGDWLEAWRIAGKLQNEDSRQIIRFTAQLAREAALLLQLHHAPHDADSLFKTFRIYSRKQQYLDAQKRFSPAALRTLLKLAARLDRLAKGVEKGDPWLVLRQYLLLKAQRA